jgi:hypothetical protein
MAEIELHTVPGWSADHVARLAVSVTSGGLRSLAQQLGVSEEEAQRLVFLARDRLPPETRAAMGERVDSDDRGMGSMNPGKGDAGKKPTGGHS